MSSPLVILFELFLGIIQSAVSTIDFVIEKAGELFGSLLNLAAVNVFGLAIAIAVGIGVLAFAGKFLLGSSKELLVAVIMFIVIIVLMVFAMVQAPVSLLRRDKKSKLVSGVVRSIAGLLLVVLSWSNPFGFDATILVIMFIIGFDMMSVLPKAGIFVLNVFFPLGSFAYMSFALFALLMVEVAIACTGAYKPYRLVAKPLAVFAVAYFALGLQPALIAAGIDLLINLTHKIRVGK